jgi:hypothetical protein
MDLDEMFMGSAEHTHVCVQKDLFGLVVLSLYEEC